MSIPSQPQPAPNRSTRDRLRSVALGLFAECGYSGASMAEIARGVGVQKATLYNYYPSKEALLLDLLESGLHSWRDFARPVLLEDGPLAGRLRRHLQATLRYAEQNPHEVGVIRLAASQIGGDLGDAVRQRLEKHKQEYSRQLEIEFTKAMQNGEIQPGDPTDVVFAWRGMLDGLLIQHLFDGNGLELLERLDGIWNVIWNGIVGEKESL